jgi:ribosomal protein S8E
VYNASNNELVRTNTLVKGAIIQIDAAPFRQWYEAHVSLCQLALLVTVLKTPLVVRPTRDEEGKGDRASSTD